MSQFILCKGESGKIDLADNLEMIEIADDGFLSIAADELFSGQRQKNIWSVVDKNTKNIDSIFTQAQKKIGEGTDFNKTELFDLLNRFVFYNISFCLWYGDDWGDLYLVSKNKIFNYIETELMEMPGEIYLMYNVED